MDRHRSIIVTNGPVSRTALQMYDTQLMERYTIYNLSYIFITRQKTLTGTMIQAQRIQVLLLLYDDCLSAGMECRPESTDSILEI